MLPVAMHNGSFFLNIETGNPVPYVVERASTFNDRTAEPLEKISEQKADNLNEEV